MNTRRKRRPVLSTLCGALIVFGAARFALAARPDVNDPRAYFVGKTMTYLIGAPAGGGYDTYGRLIAKYLAKHLKLRSINARNVSGGGGLDCVNEVYAARSDGLTLGSFNTGAIYAQILGQPSVRYDLKRFSWVGKAGDEARVLVVSKQSGLTSLAEVSQPGRTLTFGASGAGSGGYNDMLLLAHALGFKVKHVTSEGTRATQLAMVRGQIDAALGSASSYRDFVEDGRGLALVRIGDDTTTYIDVPTLASLAVTSEAMDIAQLIRSQAKLLRWTAAPPGVRPDRLSVLRSAYMAAMNDPELRVDAQKLDIPIVPADGASLSVQVQQLFERRESMMALIRAVGAGTEPKP